MERHVNNPDAHPDAPAGGGGAGRFRGPASARSAGRSHHDPAETARHLAHALHEAHLAAEGAEFVAHQAHLVHSYATSVLHAQEVMNMHTRMAISLRLVQREMLALENLATKSGNAKAAGKLAELKRAYALMESGFVAEKSAAAKASKFIQAEHKARTSRSVLSKLNLGKAALSFEKALQTSAIGRSLLLTGRAVADKRFVKGLIVAGAAIEGLAAYLDSNANTTGGKAANAVLGAGGGALVMANPFVAGADVLAPKGYKLSEIYQGTASALTAIGEGVATDDERAMATFHTRSMKGDYGKVMQLASEAGEYWANKGLTGGLSEFKDALTESIGWWTKR